jgi:hypothetical protein
MPTRLARRPRLTSTDRTEVGITGGRHKSIINSSYGVTKGPGSRAAGLARRSSSSPLLYLHGLSTSDFGPALGQFLGSSAGLSAPVITRLTGTCRGWWLPLRTTSRRSAPVTLPANRATWAAGGATMLSRATRFDSASEGEVMDIDDIVNQSTFASLPAATRWRSKHYPAPGGRLRINDGESRSAAELTVGLNVAV